MAAGLGRAERPAPEVTAERAGVGVQAAPAVLGPLDILAVAMGRRGRMEKPAMVVVAAARVMMARVEAGVQVGVRGE